MNWIKNECCVNTWGKLTAGVQYHTRIPVNNHIGA